MLILFAFLLFVLHLVFGLERVLFANEILSLIGFFYFVHHVINVLRKPQHIVLILVNFLILYGFLYSVFSYFFLREGSAYEFFRTLPIWYSILTFYLGVEFISKYHRYVDRWGKWIRKFSVPVTLLFAYGGAGIAVYSTAVVSLLLARAKTMFFVLMGYFVFLWIFGSGSLTAVVALIVYVMLLLSLYWPAFQRGIILNVGLHGMLMVLAVYTLYLVYNVFGAFYTLGFGYFTSVSDSNSLWRLMFWAYGVVHNFLPHPIFGIGFGTPIYDISDPATTFITAGSPDDEHLPYTLGMHNSYLTFLFRCGLVGFLFLLAMNYYVFRAIRRYHLLRFPLVFSFFSGYLFMAVAALFNVVLESPLYSGLYWILFGMLFGAIRQYNPCILTKVNQASHRGVASRVVLLPHNNRNSSSIG